MEGFLKLLTDNAAPLLASVANAAKPAAAPSPVIVPAVAASGLAGMSSSVGGVGLQLLLEPTGGLVFRGACNTVGIIYAVYKSFKAIESTNHADDTQWLTYWTIYGSLLLLEHAGDELLRRVPYYYHLKFGFLLWLQLPRTQGASYLYNELYKPTLLKYQDKIDLCIEKLQQALSYAYEANKLPISIAISVAVAAKAQADAFVQWFLDSKAPAKKDGLEAAPKPRSGPAAKAAAA